ncbi:MAG: hypothetical protein AB7O73_05005 [Bacteroidia bacterium]
MKDNKNINDSFSMPDGYFKRSARSIKNKIEWDAEHSEYPSLTLIKKQFNNSGFITPENYSSENEVLLELIPYQNLSDINKSVAMNVPDGYFEDNTENLKTICLLEEYKSEDLGFITPEVYFDKRPNIPVSNKTEVKTNVIHLFYRTTMYAAAASLVITIGVWVYNNYFADKEIVNEDCHTLACIDKDELMKFNFQSLDNEQLFDLVDSDKLKERLEKKIGESISDENKVLDTKTDTNETFDEELLDYID